MSMDGYVKTKRLEISMHDLIHQPSIDVHDWLDLKLRAAGFNMEMEILHTVDERSSNHIFTQALARETDRTNTKDVITLIEKSLGFKLYDWQRSYLTSGLYLKPTDRQTGRTTAYILKMLLSEGKPIYLYNQYELYYACDENHGPHYRTWFFNEVLRLHMTLSEQCPELKLRKIYFYRDDALKGI